VGDFTLEAACSVASDTELDEACAAETLESLLTKSLVSTTPVHGSTHYRLLYTTRAYTETKLAKSGEADRVARRHAVFFAKFLERDEIVQLGLGEHDLSGYALHIGNVRAALEWALSDHGDVVIGIALAASAAPLFVGLSHWANAGTGVNGHLPFSTIPAETPDEKWSFRRR
jgi:predicted ATPase